MKLIALETASATSTLCLADGGEIVCMQTLSPRNSAAELVPRLADMMATCGWRWPHVEALAVTSGPGSFTGIRVGLATAKGLAEARSIPLLAVSSLALLAAQAPQHTNLVALLDAGRSEFYARRQNKNYEAEQLLAAAELPAFAHGMPVICAEENVRRRATNAGFTSVELVHIDSAALARYAAPRLANGERSEPATVDANYLRRSEAEVKLAAGLLR